VKNEGTANSFRQLCASRHRVGSLSRTDGPERNPKNAWHSSIRSCNRIPGR
jgi:hypothetical protein